MTAQFENSFELDIQFVFEHYFNRRSISFVCYAFCYKEEREIFQRFTLSLFSPYKKQIHVQESTWKSEFFCIGCFIFSKVKYLNMIKCTWNYTQIYLKLFLKLQWPPRILHFIYLDYLLNFSFYQKKRSKVKKILQWTNFREILIKLKTFFILETAKITNTKQRLRWKFTQSHKQLQSVQSPKLYCL